MSVPKLLYNPEAFPYAGIFDQLTDESIAEGLGPMTAYVRFQAKRRAAGLLSGADYCSSAITTGGHSRRNYLSKIDIIRNNTANARQLATELVQKGCLHARSVILPVDLGYIPTWQQADYMMFWLAVISGFDLGDRPRTQKIDNLRRRLVDELEAAHIRLDVMNDPDTPPPTRGAEYFKFARAFAAIVANYRPEPHSAHRIINLIDTDTSLGCQTERLFSHLRGIPVYDVKVTGPARHPAYAFRNLELYRDLKLIFSYGGAAVNLTHTHSFRLEQRAEAAV